MEFLDERLKAARGNILHEKLLIILTSVQIITFCCLFDIFNFTFCIPIMFLAGNTPHIVAVGYNLSPRSMVKAFDALHEAIVDI